jgi:hypothetical protein
MIAASAVSAEAQPCGLQTEAGGTALYPLPDQNGKWGFVGADGEWQLAPEWRQVRPFSEGFAGVETGDGWGLIDRDGRYLVEPGAQDADRVVISDQSYALSPYKPMSQGCSAATPADGVAHYITSYGEAWMPQVLMEEEVLDLGRFSEGLAWVRVVRGKYSAVGWIDSEGDWAIEPEFVDGGDFSDGRAPAAINDENWGYIDPSGALVFPHKFVLRSAGRYGNDLAPVLLGDDAGFMGEKDWAVKEATMPDGRKVAIREAAPFADGLAAVQPGPVWINPQGDVQMHPQKGARLSICNEARLPGVYNGMVPLVVGDGTNICGNQPEISYEGPGDPRSGPKKMLWALPWARDKLVWLDRDGVTQIDSTRCRRDPGIPALPVSTDGGGLAEGAYRISLSGMVEGEDGPHRADAPCNRSEFEMDGNTATNANGPWSLSLSGAAKWKGAPVTLNLSVGLPAGIEPGRHPVEDTAKDGSVSAYLWMSVQDVGPNAPQPATYTSAGGGILTLKALGDAITGTFEATMVSRDVPENTADVTAEFNAIPYTRGPEVRLVETSGAVTALDESMPDDPLINFFTPARAVEGEEELVLSLGKFGPKLELGFPKGFSGAFTAGPDAPVSITFAGLPVRAEGRLKRTDGTLSGDLTAELGAHDQVDGAGSVTLQFAEIPMERGE